MSENGAGVGSEAEARTASPYAGAAEHEPGRRIPSKSTEPVPGQGVPRRRKEPHQNAAHGPGQREPTQIVERVPGHQCLSRDSASERSWTSEHGPAEPKLRTAPSETASRTGALHSRVVRLRADLAVTTLPASKPQRRPAINGPFSPHRSPQFSPTTAVLDESCL